MQYDSFNTYRWRSSESKLFLYVSPNPLHDGWSEGLLRINHSYIIDYAETLLLKLMYLEGKLV